MEAMIRSSGVYLYGALVRDSEMVSRPGFLEVQLPPHRLENKRAAIGRRRAGLIQRRLARSQLLQVHVSSHFLEKAYNLDRNEQSAQFGQSHRKRQKYAYRFCKPSTPAKLEPAQMASKRGRTHDHVRVLLYLLVRNGFVDSDLHTVRFGPRRAKALLWRRQKDYHSPDHPLRGCTDMVF